MKRVFILENDPDTAEIMQYVLSQDYEVKTMGMWNLDFEGIKGFHPDLLIIDHWMGIMDNFVAFKQIKLDLTNIPIILASTQTDGNEVAKAMTATCCLPKPFDLEDLINLVKKSIEA